LTSLKKIEGQKVKTKEGKKPKTEKNKPFNNKNYTEKMDKIIKDTRGAVPLDFDDLTGVQPNTGYAGQLDVQDYFKECVDFGVVSNVSP
jgi:hypothetical protein